MEGGPLATRLGDFFDNVEEGAASLNEEEREALLPRLQRAWELLEDRRR